VTFFVVELQFYAFYFSSAVTATDRHGKKSLAVAVNALIKQVKIILADAANFITVIVNVRCSC